MNLLIDVNVAIDICSQRKPHAETSALAIDMAASNEVRLWLYCGSTQTLEYNLYKQLSRENIAAGKPETNKTVLSKARRLLTEFVKDKQGSSTKPVELSLNSHRCSLRFCVEE
ncbi:hypothetical protein D5125_17340 [Magnetovirga frankeli]|uniref:hypothetical protein n=1 Tax=Magnetovirga frankeli TaxID=947516 RepID=UPI001292E9C4|nr:hypothetical protein D5125_17340 [gamma proteobacterium SS-5]